MPEYSNKLIDELQKTLAHIGQTQTIKDLIRARQNGKPGQLHTSFVSDLVCGHFQTTIEKLRESTERQDMTYARGFIVYYLRAEFKIEWKDLKEFLCRDQSRLFRAGQLIKELNPRLESHKPYCDKKTLFDEKIKVYQKQIKK